MSIPIPGRHGPTGLGETTGRPNMAGYACRPPYVCPCGSVSSFPCNCGRSETPPARAPSRGLCGTCGRDRYLIDGRLGPHNNIGGVRCAGEGRPPWAPSPAEVTAGERLATAGEIIASLPAAGLVASGVAS